MIDLELGEGTMDRRAALTLTGLISMFPGLAGDTPPGVAQGSGQVRLTCLIRYQIDPYQRNEFKRYAENWGRIIPRCGGHLIGYFLPYEGTNDVAWGLIAFDSLSSYERYRARLQSDPEARENFQMAQNKRLIVREERNFVEIVDGTFELKPIRNSAK